MKNAQEVHITSIKYKNDEKARQNFIRFVFNYLMDHNLLEKDDNHAKSH
jgi:hypothetical protein